MAEFRNKRKDHVSAAKEWLGKAEQSLEEENDIKGNLNLMLAQAELIKAREEKREKKCKYGTLLIHSMLITGTIGLVFIFGFGGANLLGIKPVARPVILPEPVQHSEKSKALTVSEGISVSQGGQTKAKEAVLEEGGKVGSAEQPRETVKAAVSQKIQTALPEKDKLAVTSTEMQQLVRAAGKSLRGQE